MILKIHFEIIKIICSYLTDENIEYFYLLGHRKFDASRVVFGISKYTYSGRLYIVCRNI